MQIDPGPLVKPGTGEDSTHSRVHVVGPGEGSRVHVAEEDRRVGR